MTNETEQQAGSDRTTDMYSPWAGVALVCVLLSFGGCLVSAGLTVTVSPWAGSAIFVLPLVSLLGVITGGIALAQISKSGGVIGGRMSAMTGVIGGIALTALLGAVAVGASIFWFAISNNVVPTVQEYANASAAGDWDAARKRLSPDTAQALGDDALASFWSAIEPTDAPGAQGVVRFDIGILSEANSAMKSASNAGAVRGINDAMFPVQIDWADGGTSVAYIFADPEALEARSFLMNDLMVVTGAGEVAVLRPDGPAHETATGVGWAIRE